MSTIILSPLNMLTDIFVAGMYAASMLSVGIMFWRGWYRLTHASRIMLIFVCLIASIFILQTGIQYVRGGQSAIPELWDVLNILTAVLCHMVIARKSIQTSVDRRVFT